jgi:hypothetical protein
VPRKEVFVSARRSQALRSKTLKLPWVRASAKILGLGIMIVIFL